MMSHSSIPVSATISRELVGTVKDGPNTGLTVRLRVYAAYCSSGYKTDYQAVETRFLSFAFLGQPKGWTPPNGACRSGCWRYSGNRLAKLAAHWDSFAVHLTPVPPAVTPQPYTESSMLSAQGA